jgi:methionine aminopeptidase
MADADHLVIDSTAIDTIDTQQNTRLNIAEDRLDAHDTSIASLLEHDVNHDRVLATHTAQIANHETRLAQAELDIDNLETALDNEVTNRTTGFTLDKVARKIHKKAGLNDFNFNHGLGHGVGINVHENPPSISCGLLGRRVLKENMVFTIEPGLYKTGFGGVRLENTVYLTKENGKLKIKSFSKVPFHESVIDYTLLSEQEKQWLNEWQNTR